MWHKFRQKLTYLDYYILIPYLLLSGIGIVMVFSASSDYVLVQNANPYGYLYKQAGFVLIGLVIAFIVYHLKLNVLKSRKLLFGLIVLLIIALVYLRFFGRSVNGAAAWIHVGGFNIQPVEFAKIILIWYLAYFFSNKERQMAAANLGDIGRNLLYPGILVGLIMLLTLLQPDKIGRAHV